MLVVVVVRLISWKETSCLCCWETIPNLFGVIKNVGIPLERNNRIMLFFVVVTFVYLPVDVGI